MTARKLPHAADGQDGGFRGKIANDQAHLDSLYRKLIRPVWRGPNFGTLTLYQSKCELPQVFGFYTIRLKLPSLHVDDLAFPLSRYSAIEMPIPECATRAVRFTFLVQGAGLGWLGWVA